MAETTKIEWADATVNPWWGCTKVSEACRNCYADSLAHRWGKDVWGPGKPREDHRAGAAKLARKLNRQAEREGRRLRVFCLSMGDWLDPEFPVEWLADLLALVEECKHLDWLLLTKRPELWREQVVAVAGAPGFFKATALARDWAHAGRAPANVWVGTTVEDQANADARIPHLIDIPARIRFLSCEPLLGPVDLGAALWERQGAYEQPEWEPGRLVHWIIAGGESGPGARPMHPEWARSLRDQAQEAGVAFFFKQWGCWAPAEGRIDDIGPDRHCPTHGRNALGCVAGCDVLYRTTKENAGRELDGRTWDELPDGR